VLGSTHPKQEEDGVGAVCTGAALGVGIYRYLQGLLLPPFSSSFLPFFFCALRARLRRAIFFLFLETMRRRRPFSQGVRRGPAHGVVKITYNAPHVLLRTEFGSFDTDM
jgi:hypothetical protein